MNLVTTRIELIRGDLVEMAAKGTKHIFCCQELSGILHVLVNLQAISRCQDPIILASGSEPEPDFTIVRLTPDRYRSRKPEAQDILLIDLFYYVQDLINYRVVE